MSDISITIKHEDTIIDFKGTPDEVLRSVNEFLIKSLPRIELAQKIMVNYSLEDILSKFHNLIKITPEGPRMWINSKKLSDREKIALQLLAYHTGFLAGKTSHSFLSIADLSELTNLNPKSVSSRLSELQKFCYVNKDNFNKKIMFKITTQGINWLEITLEKEM
ncbi:MAG: hypothetical protein CMO19_03900 [Thaumarchaeota archaeon]|nr:hypothetical protein [Nitrososphaerota archaeon]|tara:strand:+ start:4248 stop:4739 length:492 start_codon:yes stop_codon:yes gene_type:complete